MNDHEPATDEVDIRALLRPLRRRWWLVLGIVVIATAAAYYVDAGKAKVFQASTSIYVDTSVNPVAQFQGNQISFSSDNAVADLTRLAQSTAVGVQLKRTLHSPASPGALLAAVTATPDATADFVNVVATGATGAAAAALANAYAQAFASVGQQQIVQQLAQLKASTIAQLDSITGTGPAITAQRVPLQSRIAQLTGAAANLKGPEQQLDRAVAPVAPISPRPKRVAAITFFIALLNAIILVYLLEYLDRRIKAMDDIANAYGMPLLGVVPHVDAPALLTPDGAGLDPALLECMRFLRVNLSLQALDQPAKLLLVTSALPGEGKSTVARNLTLAYREAGVDVVALDADLRRPTLSHAFGWVGEETGGGLTGALLGVSAADEAVVRPAVHLPGLSRADALAEATPTIGLLPSGGRAVNPPAILGSARMAEVLQELAAAHDLVIIDSPPLLAVSDTLPLLSLVDGVILVARVGHTTRDAIRRAKAALESIPTARVFGVVAEDARSLPDYDHYSYGYGYAPPSDPPKSGRRAARARAKATEAQQTVSRAAAPAPAPVGSARRRRRPSRGVIVLGVLVPLVAAAAALSLVKPPHSAGGPVGRPASDVTPAVTAAAPTYGLSVPFEIDGVRIAVFENAHQKWTAFKSTVAPAPGMRWLLIALQVRNLTRTDFDPRVLHYRLLGPSGTAYFPSANHGTGADIGQAAQPLGPNASAHVELAFQVPAAASGLKLAFDPTTRRLRVEVPLVSPATRA